MAVVKNLPIIGKVLLILGAFGVFALAAAVYSATQMQFIGSSYRGLLSGEVRASMTLARANRDLEGVRAGFGLLVFDPGIAGRAKILSTLAYDQKAFETNIDAAAVAAPENAADIDNLKSQGLDAIQDANADVGAPGASTVASARQADFVNSVTPVLQNTTQDILALTHRLDLADSSREAALVSATDSTILISFLLMLGGLVLVMVAGLFMVRAWIVAPVKMLQATMGRLSAGDLKASVVGADRKDEIGGMARAVQVFKDAGIEKLRLEGEAQAQRAQADELRRQADGEREAAAKRLAFVIESVGAGLEKLSGGDLLFRLNTAFDAAYEKLRGDFNVAMEKLQETMKGIASNTQGVRSGAGEITQASDDLSRRTEQQAASLEETAAALDEITATVRKTAENATEARNTVATAKTDAERSGHVVREAVEAMGGIETSSKQIGNIIGVIDEIAFQTNLLALNAGVEAARAGDAGRGFAVVATEVRALAQRSADAAKEIKTLISASSQQVDTGVRLVGETGKALSRIVEQVAQLNGLVADIAASAQEQATGLNQVNSAVNEMDQVTQQNAAMVEQATAASHSLAGEAAELARLVGQFQIGEIAEARATKPAGRQEAPKARSPQRTADKIVGPARQGRVRRLAAAGGGTENWDEF
jgi:methyl-accepting chemotaxis protein